MNFIKCESGYVNLELVEKIFVERTYPFEGYSEEYEGRAKTNDFTVSVEAITNRGKHTLAIVENELEGEEYINNLFCDWGVI